MSKRCTNIFSGRRIGNTYSIDVWARSRKKRKEVDSKRRVIDYEPRVRIQMEPLPQVEFEWEPDYDPKQPYLGMGGGSFDRLVRTEFMKAPGA
jgi:hypothetical protein